MLTEDKACVDLLAHPVHPANQVFDFILYSYFTWHCIGKPTTIPEQGQKGLPGAPGETGAPGRHGLDGQPGLPGNPGKPGLSGRAGAPGRCGPAGSKGIRGGKGPAGAQGAQGVSGTNGKGIETEEYFKAYKELLRPDFNILCVVIFIGVKVTLGTHWCDAQTKFC